MAFKKNTNLINIFLVFILQMGILAFENEIEKIY